MSGACDGELVFWQAMDELDRRESHLKDLRERERKILRLWGDCKCSEAPVCPFFRRPGDPFEEGLPESAQLP